MIIKITQDQINRTLPISEGWHKFKIEKFSAEDSKDKKSKNWVFDLVCIDAGDMNGRYGYARFNSKAPGMLITSGFLPAALNKEGPVSEELEFDPDALIGKELWGETKDDVYEGKIQKKTERFAVPDKVPF